MYYSTTDLEIISPEELGQAPGACVNLLQSDKEEWERHVEGLVLLRRLAVHQVGELIKSGLYSKLVGLCLKCLDSLRSVVSKNAALALTDLFNYVPTKENQLLAKRLVPALMKRASDNTNGFIREQSRCALHYFCARCSHLDTISFLMPFLINPNPWMRSNASVCIEICIGNLGGSGIHGKLYNKLSQTVRRLCADANPEVRKNAQILEQRLQSSRKNVSFLPSISKGAKGPTLVAPQNGFQQQGAMVSSQTDRCGFVPAPPGANSGNTFNNTRERFYEPLSVHDSVIRPVSNQVGPESYIERGGPVPMTISNNNMLVPLQVCRPPEDTNAYKSRTLSHLDIQERHILDEIHALDRALVEIKTKRARNGLSNPLGRQAKELPCPWSIDLLLADFVKMTD